MLSAPKTQARPALRFPDWPARLGADDSLTPGLQASCRQTLAGFLAFCQRRQAGATVALAREYVELTRLRPRSDETRLRRDRRRVKNDHFKGPE